MQLKYIYFNAFLVSLLFVSGYVQAVSLPTQLSFNHIHSEGLTVIGDIQTINQDSQGFMWFGGHNGLVKYDGYDLHFYTTEETGRRSGLRSHYINQIYIASPDELWVAAATGVHRYDAKTDSFIDYTISFDLPEAALANQMKSILKTRNGDYWVATNGGLYHFTPSEHKFVYKELPLKNLEGEALRVNALAEDAQGYIWIGHHKEGLIRFNPQQDTFKTYANDPADPNSLSHNDVRTVLIDKSGTLWAGTYGGGLNRMLPGGQGFKRYSLDKKVQDDATWDIIQDKRGDIWVADSAGMSLLNKTNDTFIRFSSEPNNPRSLSSDTVRALFEDNAGDIWVGLFPAGVDVIDWQGSVFRNYYPNPVNANALLANGVRNVYEDRDRNLWIGTGDGLSFLNRKTNAFTSYTYQENNNALSGQAALSVVGDQEGYIWVGIWGVGVDRLEPATGKIVHYPSTDNQYDVGLKGSQPWAMLVDRDGILWIATNKGLNRYNRKTNNFSFFSPDETIKPLKKDFYLRAIMEDKDGSLWFGSTVGLIKYDKHTNLFKRYAHIEGDETSLSKTFVLSVYQDSRDIIWAGTKGGGLNRLDESTDTFTVVTQDEGLPDNVITSIVEDRFGHLWLATHNGLAKYNVHTGEIETFNKYHGLPGNLYHRNAMLKLQSGEIVVGGTKGLTIFEPHKLSRNTYVPPVVITDFKLLNRDVEINSDTSPLKVAPSMMRSIELDSLHNVFTFSFSALNYRFPKDNQYAYRLEGFDDTWIEAGTTRSATYTNLDPGTYTFLVKGSNNDGLWSEAPASVQVIVRPPAWRTWWAYLLYFLALASIVFFIVHYFLKKGALQRERALTQSLTSLDKLKDEFLAHTSHELRTPLNGIVGLAETLMSDPDETMQRETRQNFISLIHFSGKRLSHLVDDILDFSKLKTHGLSLNKSNINMFDFVESMLTLIAPLVGNKPVKLENLVADKALSLYADEKRMQQIFFNLVGNAIKFTEVGSVSVSAEATEKGLVICIADTGIGIPENQIGRIFESYEQVMETANLGYMGTGLGLAITKKLVELHGATISVESTIGEGSTFTLSFVQSGAV